jgi:hypothetical protein
LSAIYAVAETPDIELFYNLKGGIKLGEGAFGVICFFFLVTVIRIHFKEIKNIYNSNYFFTP